ncbi:MAG: transposase, partial [Kiritimatiellae bacterium]|nr:transposase [Kiritimatiellia bacterium]
LVTDLDMDARDVLPLYRERGDCENIFDEMKNQWGWRGFTAHSLKQTALFAGRATK